MKFLLFLFVFVEIVSSSLKAQDMNMESLDSLSGKAPNDTNVINRRLEFSNRIAFSDPAKALRIDQRTLEMTRAMQNPKLEAAALNSAAEDYHFLGNYADALKMLFDALQINRRMKYPDGEAETLGLIGILYNELSEYRQALSYLMPSDSIFQKLPGVYRGSFTLANIGDAYDSLHMPDSALYYIRQSYFKFSEPERMHLRSFLLGHMGNIYAQFGKYDSALFFYNSEVANCHKVNDRMNMTMAQKKIADVYHTRGIYDSGIYYARQAFTTAQSIPSRLHILRASELLSTLYSAMEKPDSVLRYLKTLVALKDSLYGPDKYHKLQILLLDEQRRQNAALQTEQEFRNRVKYIVLIAALVVFLLIAFLQLRANRLKQRANNLLQQQKLKTEATLTELRDTQSQLIQSEKMASLGQLTAGVAHEIQNPLNFVNNFSEVNTDLLTELEQEAANGNMNEVKSIAKNIRENEEKISHHGKRADAIVKAMLQHSRSGSGKKEMVNFNALAEEYLLLASHGFRAKEKLFNAAIETDFDKSISPVNIIPQEMGRVLLNLYNNAFYAVFEKKNRIPEGYEPVVFVSTKKMNGKLEFRVRDNGNGISQKILDKIFQPFFTTKPTGQGTGLGLSLSYDIIKAQSGKISVNSKEGEYAEFLVEIPAV